MEPGDTTPLRMAELARQSGVSRELIHHYLREGLLPRPTRAARYEERHLRLLRLIKRLRDERVLPLPRIRDLVTFHAHDPDAVELHLATGGDLAPAGDEPRDLPGDDAAPLDLAELVERTRAPRALVERCLALGLVRPADEHAGRFTRHDVHIVRFAARAEALGLPLEALRTIRSYVDLGFELEHAVFIPTVVGDLAAAARELALRRELAIGFVRSVLASRIDGQVAGLLAETTRRARALPTTVYRPSEAFLRKHGVPAEIEELQRRLGRRPGDVAALLRLVRLFALAGRHREVAFALEQRGGRALTRPAPARALGYALVLAGEDERGIEVLEAACRRHADDALTLTYLAAARFHRLGGAVRAEAALAGIQAVIALVARARQRADDEAPDVRAEVWSVCGWIESSLPPDFGALDRAVGDLERAYAAAAPGGALPELERLRARITSAYLLARLHGRPDAPESLGRARRAALRLEVLEIDPACELALELFMEAEPTGGAP